MKKHFVLLFFLLLVAVAEAANPVKQMLERLQEGLSDRFKIEIRSSSDEGDYFELYGGGRKVTVRANNYVSAAFMPMSLSVETSYLNCLLICHR